MNPPTTYKQYAHGVLIVDGDASKRSHVDVLRNDEPEGGATLSDEMEAERLRVLEENNARIAAEEEEAARIAAEAEEAQRIADEQAAADAAAASKKTGKEETK